MVRRNHIRLAWLCLAILLASCATAEKFARRSDLELRRGDPDAAYRTAVIAIKRQPANAHALAALSAAAEARAGDWKTRIHGLADTDTLAAARQALEFEGFRREVARYGGTLAPDASFAAFEHDVRTAAAGMLYAEADADLEGGRPKQAYLHFRGARDYAPGFRDLDARIEEAYQRAVQQVAVLPLEDQTGVPELGRALAARIWEGVQQHAPASRLQFTRLVGPDQAYARMTASELDDLSREQAIRLGRRLGADRVVWARLYGSHTDTNTDRYHDTIYRRRAQRDSSGRSREVFEPVEFTAIRRSRQVSASWEIEVLDVNLETSIARRANTVAAFARTVYTDFAPDGDCDDYCLVPPATRSSDPGRGRRREDEWKSTFGSWTVPHLLEAARREHGRSSGMAEVRGQFRRDTRDQPVFLDDLPGEGDLLMVALDDLWRPALDAIVEQDAR
jgi:hypothetical protein